MLDQIRIVLVNTSLTGNMGSAARAMKTMGLTQLVLVDPQALPDEEAVALAAGASDILAGARIVSQVNTRLWLSTDVTWPWNEQTVEPLPEIARPTETFYDDAELTVGDTRVFCGHLDGL